MTQDIPLAHVTNFDGNVRKETIDDSHIVALASDIEAHGLLHPITVRETSPGQFEVVAGWRRFLAHRYLGRDTIPATVIEADDSRAFLTSLSENMHRHMLNYKDRCMAIRRCFDECDGNMALVTEKTHLSDTTVRRYLEISQLPPEIIDRLDAQGDERITLREAYELARPPPPAGPSGLSENTTTVAAAPGAVPEESEASKTKRKKSVKSDPWVYDMDDNPVKIPEALWGPVYNMIRAHRP